jgi:hypothetical protein
MMHMLRIESADNGFIVRYDDPEIEAKNRKDDSSFMDPERQVVYPDKEGLLEALPGIMDKVSAGQEAEAMERARDFSGGFEITAKTKG